MIRTSTHHGLLAIALLVASVACSASPKQAGEQARTPAADEPSTPALPPDEDFLPAEVATVGWDNFSGSPIVLLRELDSGQILPIWVGVAEARAIAIVLHGIEFPRPMTHDLLSDLIGRLGARLDEVLIHELKEGTYYGLLKLAVGNGGDPLLVDTRPSDGLALALRTGAAIRVAKQILEESPDYDFLAPEAGEQVVRALGLTLVAPNEELRERYGLPDRPGLVVVRAEGAGREAGLLEGDLIVGLNGEPPAEPVDFLDAVRATPLGQPLRITYWREGEEHEAEIVPELPERLKGRKTSVARIAPPTVPRSESAGRA